MKTRFIACSKIDKLISKVQVETNWLLTPPVQGERVHDVYLTIRVKTIMYRRVEQIRNSFSVKDDRLSGRWRESTRHEVLASVKL